MTIRLLSTYDGFSPQSIITLDSALETALIAGGNATATLTGGTVAYRERQPVMIQPAVQKRGTVSLIANRKATVPLTEGSALTITPTAGTTGTYQRYDASGAAVGALTTIGATALAVGPFEGDFTVEIKCTTGSLVAKTADSVLAVVASANKIAPVRLVLAGDSITSQNFVAATPASVTYSNGEILINLVTHGLAVGDQSTIQVGTPTEYNAPYLVSRVIDKDNFAVVANTAPSVNACTGSQVMRGVGYSNQGFFTYATGRFIQMVFNAGLGSETIDGLYARRARDIYAKSPDIVHLLIGTNNLRGAKEPADAAFAKLKLLVDDILSQGVRVILGTLLPISSADVSFSEVVGGFTGAQRNRQFNTMVRAYATTDSRIILADYAKAVINPSSTTGEADLNKLADTVHPNALGAYSMYSLVLDPILERLGIPAIPLVSTAADTYELDSSSKNVTRNPLFVTGGGTKGASVTEGSGAGTSVGFGWAVDTTGAATAVASLVPRTVANDGDALGNNQVLAATFTGSGQTAFIRSALPFTNQIAAGDVLHTELELKVSGGSNINSLAISFYYTIGGVNYNYQWCANSSSGINLPSVFKVRVKTPKFKVAAGTVTGYQVNVTAASAGAGGVTIQVANWSSPKD